MCFFRSFEDRHLKAYQESKSSYLNNHDDSAHDKEGQEKTSSDKAYSFVGLIYPNLIQEHCKFKSVLVSHVQ